MARKLVESLFWHLVLFQHEQKTFFSSSINKMALVLFQWQQLVRQGEVAWIFTRQGQIKSHNKHGVMEWLNDKEGNYQTWVWWKSFCLEAVVKSNNLCSPASLNHSFLLPDEKQAIYKLENEQVPPPHLVAFQQRLTLHLHLRREHVITGQSQLDYHLFYHPDNGKK